MKLLSTAIGALEWYYYAVCIALMDIISQVFFPVNDVKARFILYVSSLTISALGRPLGAYIFGYFSDKYNRMRTAFFSFLMIVIATLSISLLPSYSAIGLSAPILFVFLRFVEGICIGGNYSISVATLEKTHKCERYLTSSFISIGIMFGFLLGNLSVIVLTYFFQKEALISYGWRIGLFSSVLLSLPVLLMFKKVDMHIEDKANDVEKEKIAWDTVFKIFILFLLDMVPFYLFFSFLPNYKIMFFQANSTNVWFLNTLAMGVIIVAVPFFGKLADAYGALKVLKACAYSLIAVAFFNPWNEWFWPLVFGLIMSMCYGPLYGYVALIFPKNIRARVNGVLFNLTGAISMGVVPATATYLASYHFYYISLFLIILMLIILFILKTLHEN
jgi:MHS family proline/betaine transporter-like MFS transporter